MTDRAPLPYEFAEVRARLQADISRLLPALGIRERAAGGLVTPLNPTRLDRKPGSFVIWTAGAAPGAWADYACGDKGDVIDLIQYLLRLRGRMDAYWWALDFLHLARGQVRTADDAQRAREEHNRNRLAAEAKAEAEQGARSASLFKLWLSLPPIAGTPAQRYLVEARGIDMARLRRAPGALRWAERAEWIDPLDGEVHEWRNAMVAAGTRGSKLSGLHLTRLKPDGSGKAAVERPKLMFGSWKGAAIRLSSGKSGLSPTSAAAAGRSEPLMLGEGIETTLTAATAQPDYRAWAAGSLSLMGLLDWPACASAVVLLRDNDLKPEAVKAFDQVERHWRAQARGRPLKVVAAEVGKDFNDWGREAA